MKLTAAIVYALLLAVVACGAGRAVARYQANDQMAPASGLAWSFDEYTEGDVPPGAGVFSGNWAVRSEPDAPSPPNALCQTGTAQFPAVSLGEAVFADLAMTTRFKPLSGREDQAAGLIFRVQDKDNYYILRANALENNVNLYKYASGRRSTMKEARAVVPLGQWQELRVEAIGPRLRGFLDGQLVVEATDQSYQAGLVGLWTKADSVTCFDEVSVSPLTAAPPASPGTQPVVIRMLSEGDSRRFEPADLTIPRGTTVTWEHGSGSTHTATADPAKVRHSARVQLPDGVPPWDSGELTRGQSWSLTLDGPGIYRYVCLPHEERGMLGTITVTD